MIDGTDRSRVEDPVEALPPAAPLSMPRQVLETPRGGFFRGTVARLLLRDA